MRRCDELMICLRVPWGTGERLPLLAIFLREQNWRRGQMPVLILWAVPAILVVGGGIYLIGHMH